VAALLFDTNALLWWLDAPERLSRTALVSIQDGSNRVVVSAVSLWEIAIKRKLGRLDARADLPEHLRTRERFELLDISTDHAWMAGALHRHHDDPFDRLLIAQAQAEGLVIVTSDRVFAAYDVAVLRA
jgi:PIN domain nuclease of toxin-antitoxin system